MGLLDSFSDYVMGPGRLQRALTEQEQVKAALAKQSLLQSAASQGAQARLLPGVPDAQGQTYGAPVAQFNTQPGGLAGTIFSPPSVAGITQTPLNGKPDPLLGASDEVRGLLADPAKTQAYQQGLLNQADPQYAMQMQRMAPVLNQLPPDIAGALKLGGPKALETFSDEMAKKYADAKNPTPSATVQTINQLNDQISKLGGPEDPRAAPYVNQLKVLNKQTDEDLARLGEIKAATTQHLAGAAKDAAQTDLLKNSGLDPDSMERIYQQWKGGQPLNQIVPNLGRGQQGAQQIVALQNYFTKRMNAEGGNPNEIAAAQVNLKAQTSAARKAADRGANVDMAAIELETFGDQALDAASKVNNTNFVPWNKLVNMTNEQISDPNLAAMKTAIQGVKGAYASVLTRGGTPTVDAERRGDELLSAAQGPGALKAVIAQMKNEAAGVKTSSKAVQSSIQSAITGNPDNPAPTGSPQPAAPKTPPSGAIAHLKANPNLRADFDKKYGAGAAKQVLGY